MRQLLPVGLLSVVAGCAAPVEFTCLESDPLCEIVTVLSDERPAATGVDIVGLAAYQGVEHWILKDGDTVEDEVRLVAGRDTLFRVFIAPHDDFVSREITARVYVFQAGKLSGAAQANLAPLGVSTETDLGSTINVRIAGSAMDGDATVQVELVEASATASGPEREGDSVWPDGDPHPIVVEQNGGLLRVYYVPVVQKDGDTEYAPDMSDDHVESIRQQMWAAFPTAEVEFVIGEDYTPSYLISDNNAWSNLLNEMVNLRSDPDRGVEPDQYVYGVFSQSVACSGCPAGLSYLAYTESADYSRASIGYDSISAGTMVHEVGHAHGREHSPCGGAAGPDPNYPHEGAIIGVRGYDLLSDVLFEPDTVYDFMSYCWPSWASDYTWEALYQRIKGVNALYNAAPSNARLQNTALRPLFVSPDGELTWGEPLRGELSPGGLSTPVELLDDLGRPVTVVDGVFVPYDHLPGGMIVMPDPGVGRVRVGGRLSPAL
ncbi:hypothetical protein L6R49_29720 [Myxococcota bacterium]|nr:hypothetical protein [Myxococcota bacterium]